MRRKQLVAIGGLVVLFLLIVIVTQTFSKKATTEALCKNFILNIEKGDNLATYQVMSPRLQQQVSQADWTSQLNAVRSAYGSTAPELKSRTGKKDSSGNGYTEEIYKINNGSGPYIATCQLTATDKGNRIDVFTSRLDD
jgi:hypothetical protein